jgi:hypothetical protein
VLRVRLRSPTLFAVREAVHGLHLEFQLGAFAKAQWIGHVARFLAPEIVAAVRGVLPRTIRSETAQLIQDTLPHDCANWLKTKYLLCPRD